MKVIIIHLKLFIVTDDEFILEYDLFTKMLTFVNNVIIRNSL